MKNFIFKLFMRTAGSVTLALVILSFLTMFHVESASSFSRTIIGSVSLTLFIITIPVYRYTSVQEINYRNKMAHADSRERFGHFHKMDFFFKTNIAVNIMQRVFLLVSTICLSYEQWYTLINKDSSYYEDLCIQISVTLVAYIINYLSIHIDLMGLRKRLNEWLA